MIMRQEYPNNAITSAQAVRVTIKVNIQSSKTDKRCEFRNVQVTRMQSLDSGQKGTFLICTRNKRGKKSNKRRAEVSNLRPVSSTKSQDNKDTYRKSITA